MNINDTGPGFFDEENVVLAEGPYQGTPRVFLHLTKDIKWAEIEEKQHPGTNQRARCHPVVWPKHANG
jgi:hypothetical protein